MLFFFFFAFQQLLCYCVKVFTTSFFFLLTIENFQFHLCCFVVVRYYCKILYSMRLRRTFYFSRFFLSQNAFIRITFFWGINFFLSVFQMLFLLMEKIVVDKKLYCFFCFAIYMQLTFSLWLFWYALQLCTSNEQFQVFYFFYFNTLFPFPQLYICFPYDMFLSRFIAIWLQSYVLKLT